MQILIPMAGRGQRFKDAGYNRPKPFIEVCGMDMWRMVALNMPRSRGHRRILMALDEHREFLPDDEGNTVVWICMVTEGAACTIMLAEPHIDMDAPLLVANSDQWLDWSPEHFANFVNRDGCDGAIVTFLASGSKWSYAVVREDSTVAAVAEKREISSHSTCGVYYWKRAGDCFAAIRKMMKREDSRVNGEFYLAPSFNEMVFDQARVIAYPVPRMWSMGTPEDLNRTLEAKPWRD